jgi:hypothetical protein
VRETAPVAGPGWVVRRRWVLLPWALALWLVAAGCGVRPSLAPAAPALPPGALRALVPQPEEVPSDLVPLLRQCGPTTLARYASFSTDPAVSARQLAAAGFQAGYVAEYADTAAGRTLVVTVARLGSPTQAAAVLADQAAAQRTVRAAVAQPPPAVGSSPSLFRGPLPGGGGQLVTLRFRVGSDLFLVAVGARQRVSPAAVAAIGSVLARRDGARS